MSLWFGVACPAHQAASGGPTRHGERYRVPTDRLSTGRMRADWLPSRAHAVSSGTPCSTGRSNSLQRRDWRDRHSQTPARVRLGRSATSVACGLADRNIRRRGLTHLHVEGVLPSGTSMTRETHRSTGGVSHSDNDVSPVRSACGRRWHPRDTARGSGPDSVRR